MVENDDYWTPTELALARLLESVLGGIVAQDDTRSLEWLRRIIEDEGGVIHAMFVLGFNLGRAPEATVSEDAFWRMTTSAFRSTFTTEIGQIAMEIVQGIRHAIRSAP